MIQLWISLLFFSNSHAFNKRFKFWKSEIWDNFPAVLKELLLVTECFVERSIAWRNFQHPILRSSVFCLWSSIFQTNRWEPTPTRALPKSNQVTVLGVEGMTSGFSSWGKLKKYQETYGYPTCSALFYAIFVDFTAWSPPPQFDYWASQPAPYKA